MTNSLTYRLFQSNDVPGLLRLWEQHSGWGAITEEQWREWFLDTPNGSCLVVVALDDEGEVAGQEVFTPTNIEVSGQQLRALRVSAPILRQNLRRPSIRQHDHPIVQMLLTGTEAARVSGFDVIYGMPEHAWLPVFRWMTRVGLPDFAEAEYGCMILNLDEQTLSRLDQIANKHDLKPEPASIIGDEYEQLWLKAKQAFPVQCGVIRDPSWVRFRNGGRFTIEVRHTVTNELVGYVAFKKQNQLLADILAREPKDLLPVLATAVSHLPTLAKGANVTVRAMATPLLLPVLDNLGFETADYQFAFVCNSLNESVAKHTVAPELWYLTPGD